MSEACGDRFVDLLRHGDTRGGVRFRGVQDDQLTADGWRQMQTALADGAWDQVVTSPARRCAAFAEDLAERLGIPHEVWPEVGERDFGAWEGQAADEIPIEELSRFWADPVGYTPPGAEPFQALQARSLVAWRRLLEHDAKRSLLITHGGVIRVLLGHVLGMPASHLLFLEVPHACLSRVRIPARVGEPSLVSHGGIR
ncbi:histidine phosphatase family protein [Thioflavicoccus mobilis]|nr:histidine phosphatase family protein [Thioflavicoccus mobilis]